MSRSRISLGFLAAAVVLAGCGGAGRHALVQTIPAYGEHPRTTIVGTQGSPAFCRHDATVIAGDARLYIAHSGPSAAYPADLYYVDLREDVGDFDAHACDPSFLGPPLRRMLSAPQRQQLVTTLPQAMAATFRAGLR